MKMCTVEKLSVQRITALSQSQDCEQNHGQETEVSSEPDALMEYEQTGNNQTELVPYLSGSESSAAEEEITYEVLIGGSNKGSDKLFDSRGYAYNLHKVNPRGSRLWRCYVRTKSENCFATVAESVDGQFKEGLRRHTHPPKPGALEAARVAMLTKLEAAHEPLKPASKVVRCVIERLLSSEKHFKVLQRRDYLAKNASNFRRKEIKDKERRSTELPSNAIRRKTIEVTDILSMEEEYPLSTDDTGKRELRSSKFKMVQDVTPKCTDGVSNAGDNTYNSDQDVESGSRFRSVRKKRMIRHVRMEQNGRIRERGLHKRNKVSTVSSGVVTDVEEVREADSLPQKRQRLAQDSQMISTKKKKLSAEPTDITFELDHSCVPEDFMRKDISLPGVRHMIFATDKQLQCLQKADVWYIHTTNKVVKKPFQHLLFIQAFVQREKCIEQLPLLFCTMSRMRKTDYVTVLQEVLELFAITPSVERIVADFDQALWKACKRVLPSVEVRGCARLYREAILKHISDIGLERKYLRDASDAKIMKKLMVLCFLPPGRIPKVFRKLEKSLPASKNDLKCLFQHIENRWLKNKTWHPRSWSVFNNPFRTEAKGWLKKLGEGETLQRHNFYPLLQALHNSSITFNADCEIESISNKKLQKHQRKLPGSLQRRIFRYWDQYTEGKLTVRKLLHHCVKANVLV